MATEKQLYDLLGKAVDNAESVTKYEFDSKVGSAENIKLIRQDAQTAFNASLEAIVQAGAPKDVIMGDSPNSYKNFLLAKKEEIRAAISELAGLPVDTSSTKAVTERQDIEGARNLAVREIQERNQQIVDFLMGKTQTLATAPSQPEKAPATNQAATLPTNTAIVETNTGIEGKMAQPKPEPQIDLNTTPIAWEHTAHHHDKPSTEPDLTDYRGMFDKLKSEYPASPAKSNAEQLATVFPTPSYPEDPSASDLRINPVANKPSSATRKATSKAPNADAKPAIENTTPWMLSNEEIESIKLANQGKSDPKMPALEPSNTNINKTVGKIDLQMPQPPAELQKTAPIMVAANAKTLTSPVQTTTPLSPLKEAQKHFVESLKAIETKGGDAKQEQAEYKKALVELMEVYGIKYDEKKSFTEDEVFTTQRIITQALDKEKPNLTKEEQASLTYEFAKNAWRADTTVQQTQIVDHSTTTNNVTNNTNNVNNTTTNITNNNTSSVTANITNTASTANTTTATTNIAPNTSSSINTSQSVVETKKAEFEVTQEMIAALKSLDHGVSTDIGVAYLPKDEKIGRMEIQQKLDANHTYEGTLKARTEANKANIRKAFGVEGDGKITLEMLKAVEEKAGVSIGDHQYLLDALNSPSPKINTSVPPLNMAMPMPQPIITYDPMPVSQSCTPCAPPPMQYYQAAPVQHCAPQPMQCEPVVISGGCHVQQPAHCVPSQSHVGPVRQAIRNFLGRQ